MEYGKPNRAGVCVTVLAGLSALGLATSASAFTIGNIELDEDWTHVATSAPAPPDPVVIAGAPTRRGTDPGIIRVRNVDRSGAELRFQEWDYLGRDHNDHDHRQEAVPYLIIDAGHHVLHPSLQHELPSPAEWEAGTFDIADTKSWKSVTFKQSFDRRPKLFLTVQTANGRQAVVARARKVSSSGFEAALFEEEALNDGHVTETVGYLAIHAPADSGFVASEGQKIPYRVATRQMDHDWAVVIDAELMLEEEQSVDGETTHRLAETVDVLDIGEGLFAQDVSSKGADPVALRFRARPNTELMDERAQRLKDAYEAQNGRSIAQALEHHKVAGLSIVLVKDSLPTEHLTWGVRNLYRGWPTTSRTTYQAASLSKFVAGLGFAAAHRLGDLSLDQTVDEFARQHQGGVIATWVGRVFDGPAEDYPARIDVRRLLSHTAGLSRHDIGTHALPTPCDNLRSVILGRAGLCRKTKPIHPPGTKWDYSGGGFTVAEQMLETATGRPFADYMAMHVLNPLGLQSSTFETANVGMGNLARGCSRRPCAPGGGILSTNVKAAGGLLAHPKDYARLVRLVMHDGIDWRAGLDQEIPYEDVAAVLTTAHHRGSTQTACGDSCTVDRRGIRWRNDIAYPATFNQICILGTCRDPLGRYGLGVNVRRLTSGRDGLPKQFFHGGSQPGFISWFEADRNEGEAIVFFINGVRKWGRNDLGAKALREELKSAYSDL